MNSRRKFVKNMSMATLGASVLPNIAFSTIQVADFESKRPEMSKRNFMSKKIEEKIISVKANIKDKELAWMFENCFPNTLDTTVRHKMVDGKPDTFVITGDIDAMWLRDSSAQVFPYLKFCKDDEPLKKLIEGVIRRQTKCITIDPYANAFNEGPTGSEWKSDHTKMIPELHERKWEIDSLCYPIRLAYHYWKMTGDTSVFDAQWKVAMQSVYKTFVEQQRKKDKGPYSFMRTTQWQSDTVAGGGYGAPIKYTGLIVSIFRPSDDATMYPYLIPSNIFAVTSLRQVAEILDFMKDSSGLAKQCLDLATEVDNGIQKYGIIKHPKFGAIYAYEVDGFGNFYCMDDANVPNLLGLPYLNPIALDDRIYYNTRNFVWSEQNPYFFKGKMAEGIGGPHVGMDYIWPMSLIMRALTSTMDSEIIQSLQTLKRTHAKTGFMHESFHKDNADKFTRKWFAWANTLFGELIIKLENERPYLLKQQF